MIKGKQNWTVANIKKMYEDKKILSFDHPIQRQSKMWTQEQRSLLIHSILANFPIPNVYVLREDSEQVDEKGKAIYNFSVLDGKQRLTNVIAYLNGEYPLTDNIPDVTIEDETYSIAGKYFLDLDEAVRYELLRFKFEIFTFEDCTTDDVEEIFFRLNSSVPLTTAQIAKAKVGTDIAVFINELLESRFFKTSCNFSKAQRKNSDDQKCIMLSSMLLDSNYAGYEIVDFSEKTIMEYAASIKGNYTARQQNILKSAIQYLSDAFPENQKALRKILIPQLVYLADYALDKGIKSMLFRQWFEYFVSEDALYEEFAKYTSTGSTKKQKVNGRTAIMAKSLAEYFEIDVPEELTDIIAEAEQQMSEEVIEECELLESNNTEEQGMKSLSETEFTEENSSDITQDIVSEDINVYENNIGVEDSVVADEEENAEE